ncbi:MAG: radical SAM family heme chaperone HemW [Kiritimatiellia bacterium]|nr:radical SAM family heme chaperone HemW [Kiritimatiellia bacterium]
MNEGPESGLYVHVPFCIRKCAYCDFYSLPDGPDRAARGSRYLDAIAQELNLLPEGFAPRTLFLGGGTPTALDPEELARLFHLLRNGADLSHVEEGSCEANPGTLTREKLRILRDAGINRLSIGAQSFQPATLTRLGRIHTAEQTAVAVSAARAAGFDNLSLDLIFGVPGVPPAAERADLDAALALAPEHLSLYALSLEPGTPLALRAEAGEFTEKPDDEMADAYETARERLRAEGYKHYEISNFTRPGRACRHNLLYWSGGDYIGLGPSAHSHWDGCRWENVQGLEDYAARLSKAWKPVAEEERLDPESKAIETLIFSLRQICGVQRDALRRQTGLDPFELRSDAIGRLLEQGLLESAPPDGIRLTPRALFLSDAVFRELI